MCVYVGESLGVYVYACACVCVGFCACVCGAAQVLIHYPREKMDDMVGHLCSISKKRFIISFAPYTPFYAALKLIGSLAPFVQPGMRHLSAPLSGSLAHATVRSKSLAGLRDLLAPRDELAAPLVPRNARELTPVETS